MGTLNPQTAKNTTHSSRSYKDIVAIATYVRTAVNKGMIIISIRGVLGYEDTIKQTDYSRYEYNDTTYTCRYSVKMDAIKALYEIYVKDLVSNFH